MADDLTIKELKKTLDEKKLNFQIEIQETINVLALKTLKSLKAYCKKQKK